MASDLLKTCGITMVSLFYTVIILILFILKGRTQKISGKVYLMLTVVGIIAMIANVFGGGAATKGSDLSDIFGRLSSFFMICWNYLFIYYISMVFRTDEENKEKLSNKKSNIIKFGAIIFVNLVLCMILDFSYIQPEDGSPYIMNGLLNTYLLALSAVAVLLALSKILKYKEKIDRLSLVLGIFTILLCGATVALKFTGTMVANELCFLYAVVNMYLYLSLESQDNTLLIAYNESMKQADESNKLKSEFIMNMSHQLRTPMNTILGFSELLLANENLTPEQLKEDSQNIKKASRNLLELINSILDISKLESQKEELNLDNYCLDSIIYDISSTINSKIEKENLIFTINADENCPNDLYGDAYKLLKILDTIIINAINHTNYGEVSLNVSTKAIDTSNHELTFKIANTGHSMKIENFDRSFDDLIKLNTDNKDNIDSETLNLIVAKGLIDIIGGTIEFINEAGQGTQYIIKLKQKVTTQNILGNVREKIQTRHAITHELVNLLGKKALIIDDKKINTIVLQRLLTQYNIKIDTSINPRDGVDLATNNEYDIIFTDHEMDDMGGQEVVKRLISTGNKLPPIVGLITRTSVMTEENEYNETIECPIEFRELNKLMNKIFKGM